MSRRRHGLWPGMVRSLPRSGNHLLMAGLYLNFTADEELGMWSTAGHLPDPVFHWGGAHEPEKKGSGHHGKCWIPYGRLFGHHGKFDPKKDKPTRLVYLVRNPLWRAVSHWRFVAPSGDRPWQDFINESEIRRWYEHVRSYRGKVPMLKFEDLLSDWEGTMQLFVDQYQFTRRGPWVKPLEIVGWQPRRKPAGLREVTDEMREVACAALRKCHGSQVFLYDLGKTGDVA